LEGKYEAPAEEKKFTSVVFIPNTEKTEWAKIRAELLIEFSAPMEWKVKVLVYDRDREDGQEGQRGENRGTDGRGTDSRGH
jgi:hypothetical protein